MKWQALRDEREREPVLFVAERAGDFLKECLILAMQFRQLL
jgi:hypothetical protein